MWYDKGGTKSTVSETRRHRWPVVDRMLIRRRHVQRHPLLVELTERKCCGAEKTPEERLEQASRSLSSMGI